MTIGQLYLLLKISKDIDFNDKDFLLQIFTGKSLKELSEVENFETNIEDIKKEIEADVEKNNNKDSKVDENKEKKLKQTHREHIDKRYEDFRKVIVKLYSTYVNNRLRVLSKIFNSNKKVPKVYISEYHSLKSYDKLFDYHLFLRILRSYLFREDFRGAVITDVDVIYKMFNYYIFSYNELKDNFPYDIVLDKVNLKELFNTTRFLDDDHPEKWTKDRVDKINNIKDQYLKYIYYDNSFYAWYLYCWTKENGKTFNDLNKYIIRSLYILFKIIELTCFKSFPQGIIFNKYDNDVYNRICNVFEVLIKCYLKVGNIKDLLFEDQFDNIYILKEDIDFTEMGIINQVNNKIYNKIIKSDKIEKFDNLIAILKKARENGLFGGKRL